jgi:hypothetical protein
MSEGRTNQPENGEAPARRRYTPAWVGLRDVLARLVHAGWTDQAAKEDICNALAEAPRDRKIDFRVTVRPDEDEEARWLNSRQVKIPPGLKPSDIDWKHSRPTAQWLTTFGPSFANPRIDDEPERRSIDLIELRTADIESGLVRFPSTNAVTAPKASEPPSQSNKKRLFSTSALQKFVEGEIADKITAGGTPRQGEVVKAAQDAGYKGRDQIRKEFIRQRPGTTRGRPQKKR